MLGKSSLPIFCQVTVHISIKRNPSLSATPAPYNIRSVILKPPPRKFGVSIVPILTLAGSRNLSAIGVPLNLS